MSVCLGFNMTMRHYFFDVNNPNIYVKDCQDPSLGIGTKNNQNTYYYNIGVGAYFDYKNYYFGISVPNMNKNVISLASNPSASSVAQEQRHIYVTAGGLIKIAENIELKPSVMFKYVQNAPWSLDGNLNVMFKRKISRGVSYRYGESSSTGDSVDFLAFFRANERLGFGAAYDFTLFKLSSYNSGSIEAYVHYDFAKIIQAKNSKNNGKEDKNRLSNPRYFF